MEEVITTIPFWRLIMTLAQTLGFYTVSKQDSKSELMCSHFHLFVYV